MNCPHCQLELSPTLLTAAIVNLSGLVFLMAECQLCHAKVECFVVAKWEAVNPLIARIDAKTAGDNLSARAQQRRD